MTCDKTAQIHAYHDGEMPPAERAAVEGHLAVCAECRELLADLQHLTEVMSSVPLPAMPERAVNRMYGSWWAAQQIRDRGVRRLAGWLTAAAAAILVVVPQLNQAGATELDSTAAWQETIAFIPPAGPHDDANAEMMQVAQWIYNDLSVERSQ